MSVEPIHYVVFQGKTVFMPLRYVYPECLELIKPHTQVYPLLCLRANQCPANRNCMNTLAHRVNYIFTQVETDARLIVAYYKHEVTGESVMAGVFNRDMDNPRLVKVNPFALKKFLKEGDTMMWVPPDSYWLPIGQPGIIPVESLLKK